jgi:anti-sigma B factor antagonist
MTEGAESMDGTTNMVVEPRDNGIAVVRFTGRLDFVMAPAVRERLAQSIASGHRHLVIDLSGVDFVDSSGLGVLIDGTRKTRDAGGDLCIADPRDQVRLLMALTGLERIIRRYPTLEEALAGCS